VIVIVLLYDISEKKENYLQVDNKLLIHYNVDSDILL